MDRTNILYYVIGWGESNGLETPHNPCFCHFYGSFILASMYFCAHFTLLLQQWHHWPFWCSSTWVTLFLIHSVDLCFTKWQRTFRNAFWKEMIWGYYNFSGVCSWRYNWKLGIGSCNGLAGPGDTTIIWNSGDAKNDAHIKLTTTIN